MRPHVRFTRTDTLQIAYSTFGEGPDLVVAPGWVSNLDQVWDVPESALFYSELAKTFRVTLFDKRGTGLSDRNVGMPTLEERMDDLRAVMDDAGVARAVVFGVSEGGGMAILFAATYPERVESLALFGAFACREKKPDYPWAPSPAERQVFYDSIADSWDRDMDLADIAPSLAGDDAAIERWSRYFRSGASPSGALELARLNTAIDVRHVLPSVRVPALLMHRLGDRDARVAEARYMASRLPNARLLELPGHDHLPFVGETQPILEAIRALAGVPGPPDDDRRTLATVLFTDIVDSTTTVREVGDANWSRSIAAHNKLAQELVRQYRGTVVKFTGDGFLAHFDGPARAARCALAFASQTRGLGLAVRAGVHTCEIESAGDDIVGVGVHLASRAMSAAGPGEVLATGTVKGLVSGSGLNFEHFGERTFKGFDEPVDVYRVS